MAYIDRRLGDGVKVDAKMAKHIVYLKDILCAQDIAALDLRSEAERADERGEPWNCIALLIDGQAADLMEIGGRVGLAWGSDAVWDDAIDGESDTDTVARLLGEAGQAAESAP